MTDDIRVVKHIEFAESTKLEDLALSLYFQKLHKLKWLDGNYFCLGPSVVVRMDDKTVFVHYDGLVYAKDEYHPYIIVNTVDGKYKVEHADSLKSNDMAFKIKVDRLNDWDYRKVRKVILDAIQEVEDVKLECEKGK